MDSTPIDVYLSFAEAHALGTLDGDDRAAFEAHLESGCQGCRDAVLISATKLGDFVRSVETTTPTPRLRQQVLDLADAPRLPIDPALYAWQEPAPGVRFSVVREDPSRSMRACLVWAEPGAKSQIHRHHGDEVILVLQGALRDERDVYGPGDICRSATGSVHTEEVLPGEDCVCYVVYYGDLEYL